MEWLMTDDSLIEVVASETLALKGPEKRMGK
jgi:hypothetical protein